MPGVFLLVFLGIPIRTSQIGKKLFEQDDQVVFFKYIFIHMKIIYFQGNDSDKFGFV